MRKRKRLKKLWWGRACAWLRLTPPASAFVWTGHVRRGRQSCIHVSSQDLSTMQVWHGPRRSGPQLSPLQMFTDRRRGSSFGGLVPALEYTIHFPCSSGTSVETYSRDGRENHKSDNELCRSCVYNKVICQTPILEKALSRKQANLKRSGPFRLPGHWEWC